MATWASIVTGTKHSAAETKSSTLLCEAKEFVPSFNVDAKEFVPSFSADAKEFIPSFNADAKEFVPSFSVNAMEFVPASQPQYGNCLISLGAYSDDSDEDSCLGTPTAGPTKPSSSEGSEETPASVSSRPWRTVSAEFAPRASVTDKDESSDEAKEKSKPAAENSETTIVKQSPWRKLSKQSCDKPSEEAATSPTSTMSTREGSPRSGSADESTSSDDCRSRSQSPTPQEALETLAEQNEDAPESTEKEEKQDDEDKWFLSTKVLLKWARTVDSDRPEGLFTKAAAPEPGTKEAAIAAYVADAVKNPQPVLVPSSPSQQQLSSPPTQKLSSPPQQKEKGMWGKARALTKPARELTKPAAAEECWRNVAPVEKLAVSEDSWTSKQRSRRASGSNAMSDEEIVRTMKSILNKLTIERFETLSDKLVRCGIHTAMHVELLIHEVFEKATTQHHFIAMYADLCVLLNSSLPDIIDDSNIKFKKILLNCCQASFEKNLKPPSNLAKLDQEERTIAENLYKTRMLGNVKFVGELFVRKMLASKVMLAIMEELLQDSTCEALESLAAFLNVVGPTFDTPDWAYHTTLNAVFVQVEKLTKKKDVHKRIRCLLKDVLDVRQSGWNDRRPKRIEGPLKLGDVAAKAAMESDGGSKCHTSGDDWEVISSRAGSKSFTPTSRNSLSNLLPSSNAKSTKGTGAGEAMLDFLKSRDKQETKKFDKEACQKEMAATLAELRLSHDVSEAVKRVAAAEVPVAEQVSQLNEILSCIAEQGSEDSRKASFKMVVSLFTEGHWKADSAAKGLRSFAEETCADLKFDIPTLPTILRDEMHPAFAALVKSKVLNAEQHDLLLLTV